ncbi:MAG: hypothetical protein LUQ57_03720, partial [Methylococcaceae bacterium]|nr:hypothetical protein [Methylococcaceae bacterium]
MTESLSGYLGKLAVLYEGQGDLLAFQQLAERLGVPLHNANTTDFIAHETFFLSWRDGCLRLLDSEWVKAGGLTVEIEPRAGEQRSWPAP